MFDLDMFFIIYNCKDLGTSFFSSNPLAFTKKCCTFANRKTLLIWKKNTLNNTDVNLWSMVSGE